MPDEPNSYWVLGWLDQTGVENVNDIKRLVANVRQRREMRKLADSWAEASAENQPTGVNLVPGTGLNFADDITCTKFGCRKNQIDVLFRHAWHYFDTILLPDAVGKFLLTHDNKRLEAHELDRLINDIAVVLYLRNLGALNLIAYYRRPPHTCDVLDQARSRFDFDITPRLVREMEREMLEHGRMEIKRLSATAAYVSYFNPYEQVGTWVPLQENDLANRSDEELKARAIHDLLFNENSGHLTYFDHDLEMSVHFCGTLGAKIWTHERLLLNASVSSALQEVAFRLELPSLQNVPLSKLIHFRTVEGDAVEQFRDALRKASKELLHSKEMDGNDIALQIAQDVIEPRYY